MDTARKRQSIAIIGAGGIGSFFVPILDRLMKAEQFRTFDHRAVHIYDFDVIEAENLRHQNYQRIEIGAPKADVLALTYGFIPVVRKFVENDLGSHDLFIICADNASVRHLVYQHVMPLAGGKAFLDMRSEGDRIAVYTSAAPKLNYEDSIAESTRQKMPKRTAMLKQDLEGKLPEAEKDGNGQYQLECAAYRDSILLPSLGQAPTSAVGRSCQLATDRSNNIIRTGNMVVPGVGMDILQKMVSGSLHPTHLIRTTV